MKTKEQLLAEKAEIKKAIAEASKLRAPVGYLAQRLTAVEKAIGVHLRPSAVQLPFPPAH